MSISEDIEAFGKALENEAIPKFYEAYKALYDMSTDINASFGQTRERITEIGKTLSDTIPVIAKYGGNLQDAFNVVNDISQALQRNILASAEDSEKLYAAFRVTGIEIRTMVDNFYDVGVQFSQISDQLQKSVNYVQSLGLNTKQIMSEVSSNMKRLNEYSFSNGVEGLTKMAANAALFNFDMTDTFTLMNNALNPDKAVELASSFQRMGVAVGDLTDPFQLMYKSLMDPNGLQESLIQSTRQFVEFDSKTKSFKISPEGMLQMRELANQTGQNYDNLAKSALAFANIDRAMKQIRPGIKFESEDDKKLIASIATLNKEGEYQVNVRNELTGKDELKKITDLSQTEFNKIIEEQRRAPKTMEEIARAQLTASQEILAQIRGGRTQIEFGVVSADQIRTMNEKARDVATGVVKEFREKVLPTTGQVRQGTTDAITGISNIFEDLQKGNLTTAKLGDYGQKLQVYIDELGRSGDKKLSDYGSTIENKFKDIVSSVGLEYKKNMGVVSPDMRYDKPYSTTSMGTSKIDIGGTVVFKLEPLPGTSTTTINALINSPEFADKFNQLLLNLDPNVKIAFKKSL